MDIGGMMRAVQELPQNIAGAIEGVIGDLQQNITGAIEGATRDLPQSIAKGIDYGIANVQERVPKAVQAGVHDALDDATESAERAIQWWEAFLPQAVNVSIFGGSITFSIAIQEIANPARLNPSDSEAETYTRFQRETVRRFLSLAWLLFVCALATASLAMLLLNFKRKSIKDSFKVKWSWSPMILHTLSFVISALMLGAFMFLSLAVVAYVEDVGWAGVGVTSLVALITLLIWIWGFIKP
jgi:hypothetical protein